MSSPIVINTPPDADSWCASSPVVNEKPVIRFIGGAVLEPQVDATRGPPSSCALTLDLIGRLQAALAPFQPFLDVLDVLSHLLQCFLLITEVVTNPFKIPDLLACLPGLIGKFNKLLALVPVLPQGIAQFVTMIVDVIRFVAMQIDCVVQQLTAVQKAIARAQTDLANLTRVNDPVVKANLEHIIQCGLANAARDQETALAALEPIARLLCTIRALLSIIPGGRAIAKALAFPDPTGVASLDDAISALTATRDALLAVVDVVSAIGAPFGAPFPAPGIGFKCPIDDLPDDPPTPKPPLVPTITLVRLGIGGPILPPATLTQGDPNTILDIRGTNFVKDQSQVYFNTAPLDSIEVISDTEIHVTVSADLLNNVGIFFLAVVNATPASSSPFGGLSESAGQPAEDTGVAVSQQYEIEVA